MKKIIFAVVLCLSIVACNNTHSSYENNSSQIRPVKDSCMRHDKMVNPFQGNTVYVNEDFIK